MNADYVRAEHRYRQEQATGRSTFAAGKVPAKRRVLRVECGWCPKVLQNGHRPASTGICPECAERLLED